jgi:hypothetical protein
MGLRTSAEQRLGVDLGDVRLHDTPAAHAAARWEAAHAYTLGRHIVFGRGQYRPGSPEGRRLLGHELAHVVQQTGPGAGSVRATAGTVAHEQAADAVGAELTVGGSRPITAGPTARVGVQRQARSDHEAAQQAALDEVLTAIDIEVAEVGPLALAVSAGVVSHPSGYALNTVLGLASRLAEDEAFIAPLAGPGASDSVAQSLRLVQRLRTQMGPAALTATVWHQTNPLGESLGMWNERQGTAFAGYATSEWERGGSHYLTGAAGYVGALGVAFLDAGESMFSLGFHEAANEVAKAYADGQISWDDSAEILEHAAWRALLSAAITRGAGGLGSRLGGALSGRLGLAAAGLGASALAGGTAGGLGAVASLGSRAALTRAIAPANVSPLGRAIWVAGAPSGKDWLLTIPIQVALGVASGANQFLMARGSLAGRQRDGLAGGPSAPSATPTPVLGGGSRLYTRSPGFQAPGTGERALVAQQAAELQQQTGLNIRQDQLLEAPWVGRTASRSTSEGWLRDARGFWRAYARQNPSEFALLRGGTVVTPQMAQANVWPASWIGKRFMIVTADYAEAMGWPVRTVGQPLEHHHINNSRFVTAIPEDVHTPGIHRTPTVVDEP